MNKNGVIIVIEDDRDDQELLAEVFADLDVKNRVIFLDDGEEAYNYFNNTNTDPFLIISDINMPKLTGTELRDRMQTFGELRLRTVPFLFLTTGASPDNIITAYAHSVQGFFQKSPNFNDLRRTIQRILEYWGECAEPTFKK